MQESPICESKFKLRGQPGCFQLQEDVLTCLRHTYYPHTHTVLYPLLPTTSYQLRMSCVFYLAGLRSRVPLFLTDKSAACRFSHQLIRHQSDAEQVYMTATGRMLLMTFTNPPVCEDQLKPVKVSQHKDFIQIEPASVDYRTIYTRSSARDIHQDIGTGMRPAE